MPLRDGTGPEGRGPLTGWGDGNCVSTDVPDTAGFRGRALGRGWGAGRGFSRGFGRGFGRGRGFWGRRYYGAPVVGASDPDVDALRAQVQDLQTAVQRLSEQLGKSDK